MKRKQLLLLSLTLLLLVPTSAGAQQWSGIIDPSRAVDWSQAGVFGGIPTTWPNCTTAACNTLSSGTVTAASIQAAISSAPNQSVVTLPAGTFSVGGFGTNKDNVILRGQGADKTKLVFTGTVQCTSNGGGFGGSICVSGTVNFSSQRQNSATWTAGFAKGTSIITLSSVTNLAVGGLIILGQNKETVGYPAVGDILVCATPDIPSGFTTPCATEGPSNLGLGGQTAFYRVQAISGNNVTIYPPLEAPNWRTAQSPFAWWPSHAATGVGIENMTLDVTACTSNSPNCSGIIFENAIGNWVKGVRSVISATNGGKGIHIHQYLGAQNTIRDSYFWGYRDTQQENYALGIGGGYLIENNIVQHYVDPIVDNGPGSNGFVVGYNYIVNGVGVNGVSGWMVGIFYHNISDFMSLNEGNDTPNINVDAIHGSHNMFTMFRNFMHGDPNQNANSEIVDVRAFARFGNAIGNVLGRSPYYNTYEVDQNNCDTCIYGLGGLYTGSGGVTAGPDSHVRRTFMQWGNYDTVTGAVRFVSSEVPSTITNFSNPVPASQTLPASFYLTSKPSFFGSIPWPPIGPDVSTGNITGYAGHANKIPARVCWENAANDPAYSTTPPVKIFNAATCYAPSGPPPAPPTGLGATVM